jgi:hypothetical protein
VGRTLHTRMWVVERDQIPDDSDGRCAWLNEWWKRLDDWIAEHGMEGDSEEASD